ncbi:MCE family protein [Prevotella sp. A2931]|uniref:MCE family protein n=1 Tax=Prevotella illustrans TaxID=2800387 RepID=A0ABS3M4P0_9BACT|nr:MULTISPECIES: MlaD family protein [Prevotella]MBO1363147.1 MCE family protein [Prevotella illustrans]PTL26025.1 MCE family protein [Prevotella sp. oral taxon 820]
MTKILTREVKIAIVATVGIVVLFFGLNFLKGMSVFSNDNIYYVKFKDISGLSSSNPIYADGYQIGVVKGIDYDLKRQDDIIVRVQVEKGLRIPKGSSAEIVSDLMGNVKLNILMANDPRNRLEPGDTLWGVVNGGALGKVANIVPEVQKMMPKLDSILSSVNRLLADPAIAASLHNIRDVTGDLTTSTRELNQLLSSVNRQVPGLMQKADGVLENTTRLTANLAQVDVQGTMDQVNKTLANVQEFTDRLNHNSGSLGLLMRDPALYNNLAATMKSADSLLINVREHPKRYVHFSLFGKKDR